MSVESTEQTEDPDDGTDQQADAGVGPTINGVVIVSAERTI